MSIDTTFGEHGTLACPVVPMPGVIPPRRFRRGETRWTDDHQITSLRTGRSTGANADEFFLARKYVMHVDFRGCAQVFYDDTFLARRRPDGTVHAMAIEWCRLGLVLEGRVPRPAYRSCSPVVANTPEYRAAVKGNYYGDLVKASATPPKHSCQWSLYRAVSQGLGNAAVRFSKADEADETGMRSTADEVADDSDTVSATSDSDTVSATSDPEYYEEAQNHDPWYDPMRPTKVFVDVERNETRVIARAAYHAGFFGSEADEDRCRCESEGLLGKLRLAPERFWFMSRAFGEPPTDAQLAAEFLLFEKPASPTPAHSSCILS